MGIALVLLGVGLTAVNAPASLFLFILLTPFGVISNFTGVDPRTYWAVALAIRALVDQVTYKPRVSPMLRLTWVCFSVLAGIVLWLHGSDMDPMEFQKARFLFQYFVAASIAWFAIVQLCHTASDRLRLAVAFTISVVWVSVVAVAEGIYLWLIGSPARVTGPLGNPNYLAAFLGVAAMVLLLLKARQIIPGKYVYPAAGLALVACGFTMSRTGLTAAVIGLILHRACSSSNPRRLRQAVLGSIAFAVLSAAFVFYFPNLRTRTTFAPANSEQAKTAGLAQAVSDLGRLQAGLYAITLFRENPVFGVGLSTFAGRNLSDNGLYLTTHDSYLQVLVGTGITGALLIVALIYYFLSELPTQRRLWLVPVAACLALDAAFGDYMQSIDIFVALAVACVAVSPVWIEVVA